MDSASKDQGYLKDIVQINTEQNQSHNQRNDKEATAELCVTIGDEVFNITPAIPNCNDIMSMAQNCDKQRSIHHSFICPPLSVPINDVFSVKPSCT